LREDLLPSLSDWEATLDAAMAEHHTPAELRAFRAVLASLINALPEGDDLWARHVAAWDRRLGALQRLVEEDRPEGGESA
jgi:hypothetical protein